MLAMDAIGVPNPPTPIPASSPCQSVVNSDSSTDAGMLLVTWLRAIAVTVGSQDIRSPNTCLTASICAMLPANTNMNAMVRSRP